MRRWRTAILGCVWPLALAVGGCTEPNPAYDPAPVGDCSDGTEVGETFSDFERPEKLDVLVVVDASGDVEDLQRELSVAVGEFLRTMEILEIDTRAAVATTGATGAELAKPGRLADGCETNDVVIASSTTSNWIEAMRCNVMQGSRDASDFDQPLQVVSRLLEAGAGAEFFREDARLLIVVASKDDDCSSEQMLSGAPREVCPRNPSLIDVDDAVDGWLSVRMTRDSLALAVIAGPASDESPQAMRPVCSGALGSVYAGNRLHRATLALGRYGLFSSACTDDLAPPLAAVASRFVSDGTVTFCTRQATTREPLSVVTFDGEDQDVVEQGADGYVYLGPDGACETGAIQFAASALRGVEDVSIEYCSEDQ